MINKTTIKTEWDLTKIVPSEETVVVDSLLEKNTKLCKNFINKWRNRSDYLQQPNILVEALNELEEISAEGGAGGGVSYYFGLKGALYQDDPQIKAWENKVDDVTRPLAAEMEFFSLRLARISENFQTKFLEFEGLKKYKHMLEQLFASGKYMLSEPEEKILTLYSNVAFENWVRMTSEFISTEQSEVLDEDGQTKTKNFSDMTNLLASPQLSVRESAANAIDQIFSKHVRTAEAELNSILSYKKTSDNLRGYTRPDQSRHISDDVSAEIVDTLISSVRDGFKSVHKYYELKAKLFGLPKLRYFERNILYKGMDKDYSFEQAVDLVHKTFSGLDTEFGNYFESYLNNGQFDVFTKKGKSGGAFCAGGSNKLPVYILLNYTNKLDDVSTIAHEMGHAINDELVKIAQNPLNDEVPLCLAETASTFFEDFILDELYKEMDDEGKLAMLIYRIDSAVNTVFRQIACYNFETDLHSEFRKRGYLSNTAIGEIFMTNMSAYCGPSVEMHTGAPNWWIHWSHIRRFFYVYSYSFGFLISKNLQDMVRKDPTNIERVKKFLSAGSSKSPKDILAELDIDITQRDFWDNGVAQIDKLVDELESFAKRLGKI